MSPLNEIRKLDLSTTPRSKREKFKPRRERREEARDRLKAAKK